MSTARLTQPLTWGLHFPFMGEGQPDAVAVGPFRTWLDAQPRGARADAARALGVQQAAITNWLTRGIPKSQVRAVASLMGVSTDEYYELAGGGTTVKSTRGSGGAGEALTDTEREVLGYVRQKDAVFQALSKAMLAAFRLIAVERTGQHRTQIVGSQTPSAARRFQARGIGRGKNHSPTLQKGKRLRKST